jgi:sugar phosphate isomerase/epimerase
MKSEPQEVLVMSQDRTPKPSVRSLDRRTFLKSGALAAGCSLAALGHSRAQAQPAAGAAPAAVAQAKQPTRFIHACMTLPYRNFPLGRALEGIKRTGYDHVAWGTQHREENGENRPVMPTDAPPADAAALARRCRDLGLEPVQMFSTIYPDDAQAMTVLTNRIKQAGAARMGKVLVFGPTGGGDPKLWVERFKALGPVAADHNVTLVLKQHGGETTGTGKALAQILAEVDHPNVWMSYDAGNVFWYLEVDPVADIQTCAEWIRAFCIKDARGWPRKAACGPGYGDIDHYRLFAPVAFTGLTIPLTYENITPAYVGWPSEPEGIDQWASHSRRYMENLLEGLQAALAEQAAG